MQCIFGECKEPNCNRGHSTVIPAALSLATSHYFVHTTSLRGSNGQHTSLVSVRARLSATLKTRHHHNYTYELYCYLHYDILVHTYCTMQIGIGEKCVHCCMAVSEGLL